MYKTDIDREKEYEQKDKSSKYFHFLSFFTVFLKFYSATILDVVIVAFPAYIKCLEPKSSVKDVKYLLFWVILQQA